MKLWACDLVFAFGLMGVITMFNQFGHNFTECSWSWIIITLCLLQLDPESGTSHHGCQNEDKNKRPRGQLWTDKGSTQLMVIRRYDYCSIDNFDQFDQMCFGFVLFNDESFDQFVQMSFWFCVVQRWLFRLLAGNNILPSLADLD